MPKTRSSARRRGRSPYLFMFLAAALFLALVMVGASALNTWETYNAEAAVTPVPTATVMPISVTPDPHRPTPTPVPPTPTPAPTATPSYLSMGSKGAMVTQMQTRLKELGYYTGEIDGAFGSGTGNITITGKAAYRENESLYRELTHQNRKTEEPLPDPEEPDTEPPAVTAERGKEIIIRKTWDDEVHPTRALFQLFLKGKDGEPHRIGDSKEANADNGFQVSWSYKEIKTAAETASRRRSPSPRRSI